MATRVACTAAPRAGFSPTPRMGRERPSRARRGPVRVVAGDFPLDNETIAPSEAETIWSVSYTHLTLPTILRV